MGTAAGGGFPQWNCWCACCRTARSNPHLARPRLQSSVAVSADGHHWFLLNASPDVRDQLARLPVVPEPAAVRHVPIEGVLLTDAEVDHSFGLILLREGQRLPLYTTAATCAVLNDRSRFLPVARAFADVPWTELPLEETIQLSLRTGAASGLSVEAFLVPAGPPRFAPDAAPGHTVGLVVHDTTKGSALAYAPACGELVPSVLDHLGGVDAVLFDGTFWTDDEPRQVGISTRTAREMDHVPISGDGGSLQVLSRLTGRHRVYTHINNTNPILLEQSPEHAAVVAAGLTIGQDGMCIEV